MKSLVTVTLVSALAAAGLGGDELAATPIGQQALAPLKIVAFGDSLTSGRGLRPGEAYPAVLEKMLADAKLNATVINHGVSGDTTGGALRRLQAALDEQPDILIVALGANDGLRGVAVQRVRTNLETIIESAQTRRIAVLLCGMDALPINGWQYTLDFHNIFPSLAARFNVPLVPFLLDGVFANETMLQEDFVHPNAAGAVQIARNILPYLQRLAAAVLPRQ